MINKLINLADYLDKSGFEKEADRIDEIIKHSQSTMPVIAQTLHGAVDKNGCINWGAWGGDPWALANDILKKMQATLGSQGYLTTFASYDSLMKAAGLERKRIGHLMTDDSTFLSQWDQRSITEIRKLEKQVANATYIQKGLLGRKLDIGLHKDFFTSNCTKNVGELAIIIGHELSHHILGHLDMYFGIARRSQASIDKLRNDEGELELKDEEGEGYEIAAIDLSLEYASTETEADRLGRYLAKRIGYSDGDAGEWQRRYESDNINADSICEDDADCSFDGQCFEPGDKIEANEEAFICRSGRWSRVVGDDLEVAQTHPTTTLRGEPNSPEAQWRGGMLEQDD